MGGPIICAPKTVVEFNSRSERQTGRGRQRIERPPFAYRSTRKRAGVLERHYAGLSRACRRCFGVLARIGGCVVDLGSILRGCGATAKGAAPADRSAGLATKQLVPRQQQLRRTAPPRLSLQSTQRLLRRRHRAATSPGRRLSKQASATLRRRRPRNC